MINIIVNINNIIAIKSYTYFEFYWQKNDFNQANFIIENDDIQIKIQTDIKDDDDFLNTFKKYLELNKENRIFNSYEEFLDVLLDREYKIID